MSTEPQPTLICVRCDKEFTTDKRKGPKPTYCSQRCRQREYEERHNIVTVTNVVQITPNLFVKRGYYEQLRELGVIKLLEQAFPDFESERV